MSEFLISVTPQNIYSMCTRIESVIHFFLPQELKNSDTDELYVLL